MLNISIVLPTYNRAEFVGQAIESALAQTCQSFEIIVIDDGSLDETEAAVAPYVGQVLVRYVRQIHQGVSAARNRGIAESRGKLIAFLDSDDLWMPNHLRQLSNALEEIPDAAVAFAGFQFIGEEAEVRVHAEAFGTSVPALLQQGFTPLGGGLWLSTPALLRALFEVGFAFRLPGSMVRKSFLLDHSLSFDEGISYTEDAELMIEAALYTKFLFVEHFGLLIRRHGGNADDACYDEKKITSFARRIERMKVFFEGKLSSAECYAFKQMLADMECHLLAERSRNAPLVTRTTAALRLVAHMPTFRNIKSAIKAVLVMP